MSRTQRSRAKPERSEGVGSIRLLAGGERSKPYASKRMLASAAPLAAVGGSVDSPSKRDKLEARKNA